MTPLNNLTTETITAGGMKSFAVGTRRAKTRSAVNYWVFFSAEAFDSLRLSLSVGVLPDFVKQITRGGDGMPAFGNKLK
jgi:hypothetical protein